ncbi:MAG: MFS transporter, partial [Intestinibacter sp.]
MENDCVSMKNGKIFNRDFIMVVVGQIVSLFGNSILRFALPLYLLNQTGSSSLFGMVVACSFVPMIVLGPVGGIFADRVNKKNIMVILDFATAVLTFVFAVMLGNFDVVWLILATMMILYGIQGAYQPAVQSSIPVLVPQENIMQANAIINLVNSFSGLIGPVVGGALFAFFGVYPILYVSIACFVASAVMEIFIKIPFEKKESEGNIFAIGFSDIRESLGYMVHEKSIILKLCLIFAAINFFLSALMIIGLPVLV